MRTFFLLLLSLIFWGFHPAATAATPDETVYEATHPDGSRVEVYPSTPCPIASILQRMPEGTRGYFRFGLVWIKDVMYQVCWIKQQGGLRLQFEDGDIGWVPLADLSPKKSI